MPPENEWPKSLGTPAGHIGLAYPVNNTADRCVQGQLVPTLGQTGLVILQTPTTGGRTAYRSDLEYFRVFKNRHFAVRESSSSEFEEYILDGRPIPPTLWVSVSRISVGVHRIVPIWRGNAIFETVFVPTTSRRYAAVTSDSEIAEIERECFAQGGYDVARWKKYLAELK